MTTLSRSTAQPSYNVRDGADSADPIAARLTHAGSALLARRGDFAAGKMLTDGLPERGEITAEDIVQCMVDIEAKVAALLGDEAGVLLTPPANPAAVADLVCRPARRIVRLCRRKAKRTSPSDAGLRWRHYATA